MEETEKVDTGVEQPTDAPPVEDSGDEQPTGDPPAPETKPEGGEKEPEKKSGVQRRIDQLTAKNKKTEAVVADRDSEIAKLKSDAVKSKLEGVPRPSRDDFESEPEYLDAYDKYTDARQELKQHEKVPAQPAVPAVEETEEMKTYLARAEGMDAEKYPDLDKALKGDGVDFSGLSAQFVQTSEVGPQMAYHLYKNKDLATKIADMSVAQATRELTKLETEIVKASTPKKGSGAPPPIKPVGGDGGPSAKTLEKMDMKDFAKSRNAGQRVY